MRVSSLPAQTKLRNRSGWAWSEDECDARCLYGRLPSVHNHPAPLKACKQNHGRTGGRVCHQGFCRVITVPEQRKEQTLVLVILGIVISVYHLAHELSWFNMFGDVVKCFETNNRTCTGQSH